VRCANAWECSACAAKAVKLQSLRVLIMSLSNKAVDAANEKWPGFEDKFRRILEDIEALERELA
jgi:hypothetical protein